jgi:hypothetical protein
MPVAKLIFELDPTKHLFPLEEWYENEVANLIEPLSLDVLAYVGLRCFQATLANCMILKSNIKDFEQSEDYKILLKISYDFMPAYGSVFLDVEKYGYDKMKAIQATLGDMYFNYYKQEEEIYIINNNLLESDCAFCLSLKDLFSKIADKFFGKD